MQAEQAPKTMTDLHSQHHITLNEEEDIRRRSRGMDSPLETQLVILPDLLFDIVPQINQISGDYGLCNICCLYKKNVTHFCCSDHSYCKSCIVGMIHQHIKNFTPVKCPGEDCLAQLNQRSPYYAFLSESDKKMLKKIHRNREILSNPEVKICKKEECDGVLKPSITKVQCEICKQLHCMKCYEVLHKGRCDNQNAKRYERKYRFKRCPNCKMIVEKNRGCDHITCRCTYQFCYSCGMEMSSGPHSCPPKSNLSYFARLREELYQQNSSYNSIINCSKTLELLEPDLDRSCLARRLIILFVLLTVYPAVNAVIFSTAIISLVIYLTLNLVGLIVYIFFLPLLEIKNLQLPISLWLINRNVPFWVIRVLTVPLYPVNFLLGLKRVPSLFDGFKCGDSKLGSIVKFFFLLPCLMISYEVEYEE